MRTAIVLLTLLGPGCTVVLELEGSSDASLSETAGETAETPTTTAEDPTGSSDAGTGEAACVPPTDAPAPWTYVSGSKGGGFHYFNAVAVDAAGAIYAAGHTEGMLELPGATATTNIRSPLVVKFDCAGQVSWQWIGAASATAEGLSIALTERSVYVGGTADGTLAAAPGATPTDVAGAYVAQLDASTGEVLRVRALGGESERVNALAVGADALVYAAGLCLEAPGDHGVLLAALTQDLDAGAPRCTYPEANSSLTEALGLAVAASGELIVGGVLSGPLIDYPELVLPAVTSAGFVARVPTPLNELPFAGASLVLVAPNSDKTNSVSAVAALPDGSVVLAGKGRGVETVGGETCGTPCPGDPTVRAFVALIDPADTCSHSNVFCSDGSTSEAVQGLAAADPDHIYVSGQFSGALRVDGTTVADAPTGIRMFALRLDAGLHHDPGMWSVASDQDGDALCNPGHPVEPRTVVRTRIAAGPDSVALAGGVCGSGVHVGPHSFDPVKDTPRWDAFVARLSSFPQ